MKKLVVDFDGTLAHNWDPNISVIQRVNTLFSDGWHVTVLTARGQHSCNEDVEAADAKYRSRIEHWLASNSVLYHKLSFQKPLADLYIDDKSLTPSEFMQYSLKPLKGGNSGLPVHIDSRGFVIKQCRNADTAEEMAAWYAYAKANGFLVPNVLGVIGDCIELSLVPAISFDESKARQVLKGLSRTPCRVKRAYSEYVDRCVNRCPEEWKEKLQAALYKHNPTPSFGHGDFSVTNVMGSFMIDPITDVFESYELDAAKLYTTMRLSGHAVVGSTRDRVHELGHLCRMLPYMPWLLNIVSQRFVEALTQGIIR